MIKNSSRFKSTGFYRFNSIFFLSSGHRNFALQNDEIFLILDTKRNVNFNGDNYVRVMHENGQFEWLRISLKELIKKSIKL